MGQESILGQMAPDIVVIGRRPPMQKCALRSCTPDTCLRGAQIDSTLMWCAPGRTGWASASSDGTNPSADARERHKSCSILKCSIAHHSEHLRGLLVTRRDGSSYCGEWRGSAIHGSGVYSFSDGLILKGGHY
eukprot:6456537-Amphidinium_carterae.1